MALQAVSTKNAEVQEMLDSSKQDRILEDALPTSKLIYTGVPGELSQNAGEDSPHLAITLPSIVVDQMDASHEHHDDDDEDDDPPPYTALPPPDHVGWTFDFSPDIPYSGCTSTPCRAEMPLAPFQAPLLPPPSGFHPEGTSGQLAPITVPLMPYRIFKFGSHRSLFLRGASPFADNSSVTKDMDGKTRRYGAILVAATVIVFLMVLSLLVRFIVERTFWRR